jgi:hypothetical protein
MKLMEVSNKGMHAIFEMLRNILHEGQLDKRVRSSVSIYICIKSAHPICNWKHLRRKNIQLEMSDVLGCTAGLHAVWLLRSM